MSEPVREEERSFDPAAPLVPTGNLRRRHIVSRLTESGAILAAVLAVGVLVIVIWTVAARGAKAISLDFLIKGFPEGIGPSLVGTGVIVALATAIAMPLGVLIALYVSEYAGSRASHLVKLTMDVMNGLPAIIVGLFALEMFVEHKGQSAWAASVALAIIMLPLIARGSQGVLHLVPLAQREAAEALGISRWRAVLGVILPSAMGGIVTATILSVARAAGETAPLIFLTSLGDKSSFSLNPFEALPTVPVRIFELSEEANPEGFTEAWGLSLLLISFILFASLGARALLARSKRKVSA
jgi:phosphate transport system permease protein